jgi:hypothetical protein
MGGGRQAGTTEEEKNEEIESEFFARRAKRWFLFWFHSSGKNTLAPLPASDPRKIVKGLEGTLRARNTRKQKKK